ncbi:MAG: rhodanese-like domain-containing protein [Candidatus Binatia bacterium]
MSRLLLVCLAVVVGFWPRVGVGGHGSEEPVSTVTSERVKYYLDAREPLILIDLRPVKEFQQRRIPGARSVPMKELERRLQEIPRAGRVILYCDCPQNELIQEAYLSLRDDHDYRNISIMTEAFKDWMRRKYPVETSGK